MILNTSNFFNKSFESKAVDYNNIAVVASSSDNRQFGLIGETLGRGALDFGYTKKNI